MKRLILCCDGTWNSADQEHNGIPCPTNVVKLGLRIARRDPSGTSQFIYYDQGVGTGNTVDRISGGAFGKGLEENIYDAYRFLLSNYEPGDELFLFGFSRGAFTARSIVGMVRKCGILAPKHARQYREALALYRNEDEPSHSGPVEFRGRYCIQGSDEVEVRFLGVWDTVGALGIPLRGLRGLTRKKHQFHDTELSGIVRDARQALAIDEYRAPFEPAVWDYKPKEWQQVKQVWFCGAHSDVGGGYAEAHLSDISLEWMMHEAEACGLAFDAEVMRENPIKPNCLGDIHDSKTGLYNLVPSFDRDIAGTKEPGNAPRDLTQSLHPSVLERWNALDYRPEPLKRYLSALNGSPAAPENALPLSSANPPS